MITSDTYEQIWLVVCPIRTSGQPRSCRVLPFPHPEDYPDMQALLGAGGSDAFELVYGSGRQRAEGMAWPQGQPSAGPLFHYLTPADLPR